MHEHTRMDSKAFDDFVARQQEAEAETPFNAEKERDEWLAYLDRLYSKVESFLSKYVSSRQIRLEYRPIQLNEERIGSYSARQMILRIGPQEVDLVPIGTLLIGSKGRVDVSGPAGSAQLVLVDKKASSLRSMVRVTVGIGVKPPVPPKQPHRKIEWEWKIVTRPPERRFIEITQQTFFDLIMEVANG